MKTRIERFIIAPLLAMATAGLVAGCASTKEVQVTVADLSAPARATVERVTTGGKVDQIARETEHGKIVYDVEATVGGKHLEFLIADSNGEVLGTEVPIEFGELPEPVQKAARQFFGTNAGLTIMKGVEYGETHYELEGPKGGKNTEVTFNAEGKRQP